MTILETIIRISMLYVFIVKFHAAKTTDWYLPYYNGAFVTFACLYYFGFAMILLIKFIALTIEQYKYGSQGTRCTKLKNWFVILVILPVITCTQTYELVMFLFRGFGLVKRNEGSKFNVSNGHFTILS